jgi:hypothetical protein
MKPSLEIWLRVKTHGIPKVKRKIGGSYGCSSVKQWDTLGEMNAVTQLPTISV